MKEEEKNAIRGRRNEAFVQSTRNYSYELMTPDAEHMHLRAFRVTIPPGQDHKTVAYKHEGEEFILVTEGFLEATLDNKKHRLKASESIHFDSETPHKLNNPSGETTRCVVVLYTP